MPAPLTPWEGWIMRFALSVLVLCAGPALADPRLAGNFDGIIQSAGVDSAGTTVLTVAQSGAIGGHYTYLDGTTPAKGELRGCRLTDVVLNCLWFDSYGSGTLVVAFEPDFTAFRGSWYDNSVPQPHDQPDGGFLWTGRRP